MFSGPAPRPWIMITTTGDCPSGLPVVSTGCPACGPLAIGDWDKVCFDRRAVRFFPRWQFQVAAERRPIFIDGESRLHRRDLEQHADLLRLQRCRSAHSRTARDRKRRALRADGRKGDAPHLSRNGTSRQRRRDRLGSRASEIADLRVEPASDRPKLTAWAAWYTEKSGRTTK